VYGGTQAVGREMGTPVGAHAVGDVRQSLQVGEVERVRGVQEQIGVAAAHAGSGLARQVPGDQLVGVAAVARGPDEALCGGEAKRDAAVDHALAVHLDVRLEPGTLLVDHHRGEKPIGTDATDAGLAA